VTLKSVANSMTHPPTHPHHTSNSRHTHTRTPRCMTHLKCITHSRVSQTQRHYCAVYCIVPLLCRPPSRPPSCVLCVCVVFVYVGVSLSLRVTPRYVCISIDLTVYVRVCVCVCRYAYTYANANTFIHIYVYLYNI